VADAVFGLTALEGRPDADLVEQCVEGDGAAWRQLHRRYYPMAAAFLRKLGVPEHDLEDASQDVFLQMFRYLPRFRGDSELKTWMYRLCITQARRVRRFGRVTEALKRALSLTPAAIVSGPSFSEDHARRQIDAALSLLSDDDRAVFVLYEMEGMPGKEIATVLACPEASVWRKLHYARQRFRIALGLAKTEIASST
jgi:RNA polymerase sigma-70 factor (ECF subfamily)